MIEAPSNHGAAAAAARGSIGVVPRSPSMSSNSFAPASTRASACGGATTCRPTGNFSLVKPHGSESAGQQQSVIA